MYLLLMWRPESLFASISPRSRSFNLVLWLSRLCLCRKMLLARVGKFRLIQDCFNAELPSPLLLLLLHPFYSGHIHSLYRHRFSSAPRIPDKIHILHPRTYIILHCSGRFYVPKAFSFFPLFPARPESYFFSESLLTVIFQYTLTHHR